MTHGTNKTDRVTRTHGTPKTDRIVRTRDRQDRQDRQVRDERQDRQILHLNLTFQVTCVGQLSQFLRCFLQCHLFPISSFDLLRVVSFWLCVISIFNCVLKVKATERIKAVRGGGEGRQFSARSETNSRFHGLTWRPRDLLDQACWFARRRSRREERCSSRAKMLADKEE